LVLGRLAKYIKKSLESSELSCRRRKEKIIWKDRLKNGVLIGVHAGRNILHIIETRKAKWIGLILLRNCLLKHVMNGKIEGTER